MAAVDLSQKFDGFFFGFVASIILFGVTVVQTWFYVNSNNDRWAIRSLVFILVLFDIASTATAIEVVHNYLIVNFGNVAKLNVVSPVLASAEILTILDAFIVQLFFAHQVHSLNRSMKHIPVVVPSIIVFFAVAGLATGLAGSVDAFEHPEFDSLTHIKPKTLFLLRNAFALISDVAATSALLWSFRQSTGGTKLRSTETLLQKLFQYTVARGTLVSLWQLCYMFLFAFSLEKFYWIAFHLGESKIYVVSMIAMLNSRSHLRATTGDVSDDGFTTSFHDEIGEVSGTTGLTDSYPSRNRTETNTNAGDPLSVQERGGIVSRV